MCTVFFVPGRTGAGHFLSGLEGAEPQRSVVVAGLQWQHKVDGKLQTLKQGPKGALRRPERAALVRQIATAGPSCKGPGSPWLPRVYL